MITDEMVHRAWKNMEPSTSMLQLRNALEAVAPLLIADYSAITKQVRQDLRDEIQEARTILAGTDIGSLPNDMPLVVMCAARMQDIQRAKAQGMREAAEIARVLDDTEDDTHSPDYWSGTADVLNALLVRAQELDPT